MVKHLVTMRCDISTRSTKGTTALDTSKKKRHSTRGFKVEN